MHVFLSLFAEEWAYPLYALQLAFTIWMAIDASRRGYANQWMWIILVLQPIGSWVYFFVHKAGDLNIRWSAIAEKFRRPPPLEELRYRAEQSPTPANWLTLGERLLQLGEWNEAAKHLDAVLAREPDHTEALYLIADARRQMKQYDSACSALERLIAKHPMWRDYLAWRILIELHEEFGNDEAALRRCRELYKSAPRAEHACTLADHLLAVGEDGEARNVLRKTVEDYRYAQGVVRRRDRPWIGTANKLLKRASERVS